MNFCRPSASNINTRNSRIQIILTTDLPLAAILSGFHSTVVLNMITADMAYCLFPKLTLVLKTNVRLQTKSKATTDCLEKYNDRGWKVWRGSPHNIPFCSGGLEGGISRRVGDASSLTIRFPNTKNEQSTIHEQSEFHIGIEHEPPWGHAKISAHCLTSPLLERTYVVGCEFQKAGRCWAEYIGACLTVCAEQQGSRGGCRCYLWRIEISSGRVIAPECAGRGDCQQQRVFSQAYDAYVPQWYNHWTLQTKNCLAKRKRLGGEASCGEREVKRRIQTESSADCK